MQSKKGFTLIEILVVVAIIALVSTFAAVAVNSARSKQRDATRLAGVRLLQSALEDYFNETNSYPTGDLLPLGDAAQSSCLSLVGFQGNCSSDTEFFLRVVPETYADGLDGLVTCGQPARNAACYTQRKNGEGYVIHFELENGLSSVGLQTGINCATPNGMESGICPE